MKLNLIILFPILIGSVHINNPRKLSQVCFDDGEGCRAPPPYKTERELEHWATEPVKKHHNDLFRELFKILMDQGIFYNEKEPRNTLSPFDFKLMDSFRNFSLALEDSDIKNDAKLIDIFQQIVDYSPRSSHPFNLDIRAGPGLDPFGLIADWIISTISGPSVTYIFSPVFHMIEVQLYKELRTLFGYTNGEGIIETRYANALAIQAAMSRKFKGFKDMGARNATDMPAIFISEHGDQILEKKASVQGIGADSVIRVKTHSENGTVSMQDLEERIAGALEKGSIPILLIASAGTYPFGAIDPILEMTEIAKKYDIWVHIDGEFGAGIMFSRNKSNELKGIEKADSIGFSPNHLFGTPLDINFFLTQHKEQFSFGNQKPGYLNRGTLLASEKVVFGDQTIQMNKRPNAFKFWFVWKMRGHAGMAKHIDHIYDNMQFAREELRRRSASIKPVLHRFQMPSVHFYYIPHDLREKVNFGNPPQGFIATLNNFTSNLRDKLLLAGIIHLSVTENFEPEIRPNFMSLVLTKSVLSHEDIKFVFDQIETCGDILDRTPHALCIKEVEPETQPRPRYVSTAVESIHKKFLQDSIDVIMDRGLFFQEKREEFATKWTEPEDLTNVFDISIREEGLFENYTKALELINKTIDYSSHLANPLYMYQHLSGLDPYSVMADILLSTIPSNQDEYIDNPILTMIQKETGQAILDRVGWLEGQVLFPPADNISMILSIHMARRVKFPEMDKKGLWSLTKTLRIYFSIDSYYQHSRGAFYNGYGSETGVPIPHGENGKMNITMLKNAIEDDIKDGREPLMVAATFGTPTLGALDPLEEIAEICAKYKLWFHIDGTGGGSFVMSNNPNKKGLLKGLERANSFSFNPSKMLGTVMPTTFFVLKKGPPFVRNALGIRALTGPPKFEQIRNGLYPKEWDMDDGHWERARRANFFKFWLSWKAKGSEGMSKHIDYIMDLSKFTQEEMQTREGFVPILKKFELSNVVFTYVPKKLRHIENRNSKEFISEMEKFSNDLQTKLVFGGLIVLVPKYHHQDIPFQMKLIILNSGLNRNDILYHLNEIERIGNSY